MKHCPIIFFCRQYGKEVIFLRNATKSPSSQYIWCAKNQDRPIIVCNETSTVCMAELNVVCQLHVEDSSNKILLGYTQCINIRSTRRNLAISQGGYLSYPTVNGGKHSYGVIYFPFHPMMSELPRVLNESGLLWEPEVSLTVLCTHHRVLVLCMPSHLDTPPGLKPSSSLTPCDKKEMHFFFFPPPFFSYSYYV